MAGTANSSYYQTGRVTQEVQHKEHLFHLYMFQHTENIPNANQKVIVRPNLPHSFGLTIAIDWALRDGLGPNAKNVARAQGMALGSSIDGPKWLMCHNIVFTDERFKGSTLRVLGNIEEEDRGVWSIVGGTGEFSYAQGDFTYKYTEKPSNGIYTREVHIRVLCPTFVKLTPPNKVGPVGGSGGKPYDIPEPPRLIESVTIRSGEVIDSIAYSYIDQAGKKQTAGPWGGNGGLTFTIVLAPSEAIKTINGTTGDFMGNTVVTSLTFVTNVTTYGPFGKANGTPFSVPDKDNNNANVMGFFAQAGSIVDALGFYLTPSVAK